jgi:hypothetical protein
MLAIDIKDALGGNRVDAVFIIPNCKQCYRGKIILGNLDEERVRDEEFHLVG